MSPSSIGGGITNFLRRGDNPLLSYRLRERRLESNTAQSKIKRNKKMPDQHSQT